MEEKAKRIVEYLAASLDTPYLGSSSMTPAVYDTAWVAMVSKCETRKGVTEAYWLFPECFQTLLNSQEDDGGFGSNGSQVDGILSTMAALLALCAHQKNPLTRLPPAQDLGYRIKRGQEYLDRRLQVWDVRSTVHVGFEILVPSLLLMLQKEGLSFHFPGHKILMVLNQRKVEKIRPEVFYSSKRTTLLHSLEAFIGVIDFDKISHFINHGAMMGSPSSTAAFLIHSSTWHDEAEKYLRFVVNAGNYRIPSAFPISVFETSWVLSTLLGSGFTAEILGLEGTEKLTGFLQEQLEAQSGTTGFAPGILPDADDTAKSIHSLNLAGKATACEPMFVAFEASSHFKTYDFETSESFSANCNVLIAILGCGEPHRHKPQISKALAFLCKTWYQGAWRDKWNISPLYSMMLLSDALVGVVRLWDSQNVDSLSPNLLAHRLPLITMQLLVRALSSQAEEGSWDGSTEVTAYALLMLKKLSCLSWIATTQEAKLRESIALGTDFLEANEARWHLPGMVWVEKVTYGSKILSESYCLAALEAPSFMHRWGGRLSILHDLPMDRVHQYSQLLSALSVLGQEPEWKLRASIIEGHMLAPLLRRASLELGISSHEDRKGALQLIPLLWTACNNASGFAMSIQAMFGMMIISMLDLQQEAGGRFGKPTKNDGLREDLLTFNNAIQEFLLRDVGIQQLAPHQSADKSDMASNRSCNGGKAHQGTDHHTFLHNNETTQEPRGLSCAMNTYHLWVQMTPTGGATKCSHSLEFFHCLLASLSPQKDTISDPISGSHSVHLARDVCNRLALLCRQNRSFTNNTRGNVDSAQCLKSCYRLNGRVEGEADVCAASCRPAGAAQPRPFNFRNEYMYLTLQRLRPDLVASTWKALDMLIKVANIYEQIYGGGVDQRPGLMEKEIPAVA